MLFVYFVHWGRFILMEGCLMQTIQCYYSSESSHMYNDSKNSPKTLIDPCYLVFQFLLYFH